MSDNSRIEWTDATWNPTTGCTKVSPGCDHCYAEGIFNRFNGPGAFDTVRLRPERLDQPLRWRRPRRVFVNSMSDLFHDDVPDDYIARVFAVMGTAYHHTFQVLTKRHGRMRSLLNSPAFIELFDREFCAMPDWVDRLPDLDYAPAGHRYHLADGPLSNVWLGVSVETQQWADIRIPALLETPAAVRFLSCEPLLGPVSLDPHLFSFCRREDEQCPRAADRSARCPDCLVAEQKLGWVIVGGESGHGFRPLDMEWARRIRDECLAADIPFLFKQIGGRTSKAGGRELDGRTWDEYPTTADAQGVLL